MPVLALRDLSFRYRRAERPALRGVGLELEEGEVVWLAGPSGAGKTTLACAACGVAPEILPGEVRGEARLFGRPVGERRVREWADTVGVLFQDFEAQIFSTDLLLEAAFGPENLALPREEVRRRAEEALERTGLARLRGRDPATLSGGEKQRLALASILALEPRLLLLDEPTTDLDPGGRRDLLALVRGLAGEGRTTLLIEHDPEAMEVADRTALLEAGRVADILTNCQALGSPDRLEAAGVEGHPVVRALLAAGHPGEDPPSDPAAAAAWLARSGLALAPPAPDRPVPGDVLLRARGLGHAYLPGREALRGVELELREGEVIAVVGPNGSGKTTLAHALAGLLRPTAGEVRLRGRPVRGDSGRVGLVFQNPDDQIFSPRVADEVAFAPRNAGLPEEEIGRRVAEALEAVGLAGAAEADPFELTKGERQKVAVASVLAQRPEVLVLDEPTTGLDARERRGMLGLLGGLAREGHAVVLVTHSMEVAAEMADRVVVLRDGSIAAEGRPREIFGRPGLLVSASLSAPAWAELTAPYGPPALTLEELRARRKGS